MSYLTIGKTGKRIAIAALAMALTFSGASLDAASADDGNTGNNMEKTGIKTTETLSGIAASVRNGTALSGIAMKPAGMADAKMVDRNVLQHGAVADTQAIRKENAGELISPWAVRSNGKTVAYVRSKEAGESVITGLRIHYYRDSVTMQQDAELQSLVTVSKVTGVETNDAKVKMTSVQQAVSDIVEQNKKEETPAVQLIYSKTLKETREIKPARKVIKTAKLEKGQQKVENKGTSGSRYIEREVTQVNDKVVDQNVMKSKVQTKPQAEIVYEGTALSSENKGKAIVALAKKYLGNPYVWGGESLEHGVDCSGYMMKLYEHYGIQLPHSSSAQGGMGKEVSHSDMQPGDLIVYPGHVAMYAGNGQIIHAAGKSQGIIMSDEAGYSGKIKHIRRIFGTGIDHSTDSMFPDADVIQKAYEAARGFD